MNDVARQGGKFKGQKIHKAAFERALRVDEATITVTRHLRTLRHPLMETGIISREAIPVLCFF